MLRIFRLFISLLVSFELIFGGMISGGAPIAPVPDAPAGEYGSYVNAFVGTGGVPWVCGMLSPAACSPFGAVRVGPDTCAVGGIAKIKTNTSGYYYEHRHMLGFSLGRLSGTGARDYGMFRVTPGLGAFSGKTRPAAYAYSHNAETACPGYYAVRLPGAATLCEMTATSHVAALRFTFDTARDAGVYIDAAAVVSAGEYKDARIQWDEEARTFSGQITLLCSFSDRFGGLTVYLAGDCDTQADFVPADSGDGLWLDFGSVKNSPVTLRMAISFISVGHARANLEAEAGDAGFNGVLDLARDAWEERLASVVIDADDKTKRIFYTALYHSMIMPTDFTESNGEYLGFDRRVHTADGYTYRTDMSLWDTARCTHSLYTLIAPDIQDDCLKSLLAMDAQGGVLPRWPMGCGYTGSMFGNPANIVFAESYFKGLDFDAQAALDAMKRSSHGEYPGKDSREGADLYDEYGYIPDDILGRFSVSKTLVYAWEDDATARLAAALGDADAAKYAESARNYRNLWDPETKYFRPRNSDGSWGSLHPEITSFFDDIFGTDLFSSYCEGSARQWRWSVQQDPADLIALFGSEEIFVRELEDFMKDASLTRAAIDPGSGYWIGNQHDIHTAYLFNEAGKPDLTQKWVRWTLRERFSLDPDGLDGNDDGGTISSWYVLSALGFYPIAGTDRYWIGSPAVDNATLELANGARLKIETIDQSPKNVYVREVLLDGDPIEGPYLTHEQIRDGGTLTFIMTDKA
ncbi:MAG: GH92 family glycosyl hydrolase [Clostridia bacterium]|nr:GH92 family glycosyl hydrolase [Clostridia bacterium]